ncbi:hypothetical protein [Robertkochia solimangrovi]|uniref:hypothetical protein n=1 Tax=Robertkochia solimangrovi TaxID=2213046 RepID=UPI00117F3A44|nr:hypothetical protein [Robertkochia solimangrovi]TRZ43122.1 hypothetical protein DMZ48_10535 [Robertkochia solimangrovi]
MRNFLAIIFLILLSDFGLKAQTVHNNFVITDKYICSLNDNGKLNFFDLENGSSIEKEINSNQDISILTTDVEKNIVVLDKQNQIKRYNYLKNTWTILSKSKNVVTGIVFNSKNKCYLITNKGIEDAENQKICFSKKSLNHQINYQTEWGKPYCYYIDKDDRIWLGFGYGEWGGNLFIFNTISKNFEVPDLGNFRIELWPIKSFFEDESSVYLSSGLQHMMNSGIIIRFDNLKAYSVLESDSHWSKPTEKDRTKTWVSAEYIGPATYSKHNNSIYFYSQNGIFKGDKSTDLSKIENWKIILQPKLNWKYGQPDAVGSPMNVLKLEVLNENKIIFLSQNDGIGFYDNKELKMIK